MFSGRCLSFPPEFGTLALRSQLLLSFSLAFRHMSLWVWEKQLQVWMIGVSYKKHHFLAFTGRSHSLDAPDLVFSTFSTFEQQLAIAVTPRTRDLASFMMTTTTTTMQPVTTPLCTCTRGNQWLHSVAKESHQIQLVMQAMQLQGICTRELLLDSATWEVATSL